MTHLLYLYFKLTFTFTECLRLECFTWASCALWPIFFLIDLKLSNVPHRFANSYISVQEHVSQVPHVQIVPIKAELAHNTNMYPHHKPQGIIFPHVLNLNNKNQNKTQYKKNLQLYSIRIILALIVSKLICGNFLSIPHMEICKTLF